MLKNNQRFCDACRQKLPATARLALQAVSKEEAAELNTAGVQNPDGTVTIDLCLNCRVRRANRTRHQG